jgi:hypothetical protein
MAKTSATRQSMWKNYGDINPREHGGIFIRDNGTDLDIVEANNLEGQVSDEYIKKNGRYLFNHRNVTKIELLADAGLLNYSGASMYDDNAEAMVIGLATCVISYSGGDDSGLVINNWNQGLKYMGINSYD